MFNFIITMRIFSLIARIDKKMLKMKKPEKRLKIEDDLNGVEKLLEKILKECEEKNG
ncbi:hypothetical protein [Helicobacter anseris]|uniref:hypothetical protein n=1 Tax=Helicobacter anseris TaxID=375926 RepID=UPI00147496A0|nr:hypothetical protein [Helicobacter anseris]